MTYKAWSFYDLRSGLFTGRTFFGPANSIAVNTPDGYGACEGCHNPEEFRVDVITGNIIPV